MSILIIRSHSFIFCMVVLTPPAEKAFLKKNKKNKNKKMYFFGIKITLNPKEGKNWNPMRFQKNQITRKLSNYSNYLWKLLNLLKNGVPEVFNKFQGSMEFHVSSKKGYLRVPWVAMRLWWGSMWFSLCYISLP